MKRNENSKLFIGMMAVETGMSIEEASLRYEVSKRTISSYKKMYIEIRDKTNTDDLTLKDYRKMERDELEKHAILAKGKLERINREAEEAASPNRGDSKDPK